METFQDKGYGIARFMIKDSDKNYNYIAFCTESKESVIIDPLGVNILLEFIRDRGLKVKYVINTHAHPDHIQGNNAILKVTTSKILIHKKGKDFVSPRSDIIDDGDIISLGKLQIKVIHTPGHCPEHVCLILDNNVFAGDTLFLAGCGNTKFRGNVDELYRSIAFKLRRLPDEYRIFFGHDYSEKNLKFALSIEPGNETAKSKLNEVTSAYSKGTEPSPSTIGEEKQYNPFLRFDEPTVIEAIRKNKPSIEEKPELIFRELRELRNNW